MKREEIKSFVETNGHKVRIFKSGHFALDGRIDEIYSDSLLFITKQAAAIISFDVIEEIHSVN